MKKNKRNYKIVQTTFASDEQKMKLRIDDINYVAKMFNNNISVVPIESSNTSDDQKELVSFLKEIKALDAGSINELLLSSKKYAISFVCKDQNGDAIELGYAHHSSGDKGGFAFVVEYKNFFEKLPEQKQKELVERWEEEYENLTKEEKLEK